MTIHTHRLIAVVPAALAASFNTWWANNVDTGGAGHLTFTVPLNAAGDDSPATHYWCSAALTVPLLRKIIVRLCNLASITFPPTWDTMTKPQQMQWILGQRPAIRSRLGIWIDRGDNDGQWNEPEESLTAISLKRRQVVQPG